MIKRTLRLVLVLSVLALTAVPRAQAQEVVWGATFDFFFDNREYKSDVNWPQTLFGARIAPELGVRWEGRHSLMMGYSMLANFGAKPFQVDNELFGYYQYDSPKFKAYAGVIPRHKMIGDYPSAFFSDSVKYYDPNITGLLLQYSGGRGWVEFGCDWNSMITNDKREKFMLFSAGRVNKGIFYAGYHLTMYHHAGRYEAPDLPEEEKDGVVDNVLIHPHVGLDLAGKTGFQLLSVQAGWMQAFQNDRKYVDKYVTPGGFQLEVKAQKWNFGIFNTLYVGKNLMPYFVGAADLDYGTGLYWGEPWYRTHSNVYDRLEVYWQPLHTEKMKLRVASVHHYDGYKWGWQQKVIFSVNLGQNRLFKKK